MGSRRRLGFTVCDIVITVRKLETYIDEGHVHKLYLKLYYLCGNVRLPEEGAGDV